MSRIPPIRLFAAAALVAAAPFALQAQESDALPFQAGRWAVELSSEENAGSLAFLRFTSPGGAWLFAPGISVAGGSGSDGGVGGTEESDISSIGFDLRVGYRGYRPLGRGVVSHLGAGALGAWTRDEEEFEDGTSAKRSTSSYGIYGELGGSYFFTPRFGLGASAIATFTFRRSDFGFLIDQEQEVWAFAMPATRLMVTIVL